MNMNTQSLLVNTHPYDARVPVVLAYDTRRTLGHLFDTLTALGILTLEVDILDAGRCCCDDCQGNEPNLLLGTVQTLHETGRRAWFRHDENGSAARFGCAGFQFMPFELEVLDDALFALYRDALCASGDSGYSWVKFDALRRFANGATRIEIEPVREWVCDIRDSQNTETRLWD